MRVSFVSPLRAKLKDLEPGDVFVKYNDELICIKTDYMEKNLVHVVTLGSGALLTLDPDLKVYPLENVEVQFKYIGKNE